MVSVDEVLAKARENLEKGKSHDALLLLSRPGLGSPVILNARGVCLLRLGNYGQALTIFRDLAFPDNSICMDHETPVPFRTNFITALLFLGSFSVALSSLNGLSDEQHPAASRLRESVRQWKSRQTTLKKVLFAVGLYGDTTFTMESPGDLEG